MQPVRADDDDSSNSYCCISVCKNYKDPNAGVDLYPLPKTEFERDLWCQVFGIPQYVAVDPSSRVCGAHFRYKYFLRDDNKTAITKQIPYTILVDENGQRVIGASNSNSNVQIQNQVSSVQKQPVLHSSQFHGHKGLPATILKPPVSQSTQLRVLSGSSLQTAVCTSSISTNSTSNNTITTEIPILSPGNLFKNSQLMLECEEETLSPAQLSLHYTNWIAFKETIRKDLAEHNASSTLHLQTPNLSNNVSTISKVQINSTGQVISQTSERQIGSVILTSSSPQIVHIPSSSQNVRPVTNLNQHIVQVQPQNSAIGAVPSVSKLPFRIVQVQSQNSGTASIQFVNTSSTLQPQFVQAPFSLQGTTLNQSSNLKQVSSSPLFFINSQSIKPSVTVAVSSSVSNAVSVSSAILRNDNTSVSSLLSPSDSSVSDASKANVIPVQLRRVESVGKISETKESSFETILPILTPKVEKADSFPVRTNSSSVNSQDASSSVTTALGKNNENDPDFSNVAAVYGEETLSTVVEKEQATNFDGKSVLSSLCSGASILKKYFETKNSAETSISSNLKASLGPVIVDVVSAKEGGLTVFSGKKNALLSDKTENSNGQSKPQLIDHSQQNSRILIKNDGSMLKSNSIPTDMNFISKVMHPHSIFSLQKSIPVIPGGQLSTQGIRYLFNIKIMINKNRVEDAHALRERLRAENFIVTSVWWLVQKHYIPLTPPCTLCGSTYFTVNRNKKFFDGYCWTCQNKSCKSQEPIKRPSFFSRFQFYTLEDLLLLTYHWACQSDLEDIIQDVNLSIEKIFSYFSALQELCRDVVEKKGKLGTCLQSQVEASVVKVGNNFILGAYERSNRAARLEALSVNEAFSSPQHLVILDKWLNRGCTLISDSKISDEFLPDIQKLASDPSITDIKSKGPHTINISRYLVRNMISLFGKLQIQTMSQKVIQGFLYELQWRERYGRYNDTAFWSVFEHISNLDDPNESIVHVAAGDLEIPKFIYLNDGFRSRWGIIRRKEAVIENSINNKPQLVQVPENVYSKELASYGNYKFNTKSSSLNELMKSRFWHEGSLNMLFQDLPEVPGGESNVNSKSFLNIKIVFAETPEETEAFESDSESLGLRLSAEGYKDNPVRWLVKKSYIKSVAPCYVCNKMAYLRSNPKFTDGCSWSCQNKNCKFENIFKRPQFYARFPMLTMNHMSAMIFHWSVQSDVSLISVDVPLDLVQLYHVWRSFQVLCSTTLRKKKVRLGGDKQIVEIALVQYGKLYILGAMERSTRHTLLRTFPVELKQQVPVFFRMISQWILPQSIVVINATKYFQMPDDYIIKIADPSVIDINDSSYHVLNVTSYLLRQISSMFGHLKADDVRVEVLQTFLDELMWRERFGRLPRDAFFNILKDIFSLEGKDGNFLANPPPIPNGETQLDSNTESASEQEEEFMYDKLAIPSETSDSKEKDKTEIEQKIDPASLPNLRVVLERIPETVLRFYNCFPPESTEACSTNVQKTVKPLIISKSQISKKYFSPSDRKIFFEPHVSPKVSTSTQKTYSKSKPISIKQNSGKLHKKRKVSISDEEEEIEILEQDSPENTFSTDESSLDSSNERTKVFPAAVKSKTLSPTDKNRNSSLDAASKVGSSQRTFNRSKSTPSNQNKNRVHKKKQRITSYEKDELFDPDLLDDSSSSSESSSESQNECPEITSSVATRRKNLISVNREIYFAPHVVPKVSISNQRTYSRSKSSVAKHNNKKSKMIYSEEDGDSCDQNSSDNKVSSESCLKSLNENNEDSLHVNNCNKRQKKKQVTVKAESKLICIECGAVANNDHFSKEFLCMDCKPPLYTTCCCNAFMDHRGILLFGKRGPRKSTELYGLHRVITLQDSYSCVCGFQSNVGNKLASHLVKCGKSTCYYQADIS